MSEQDGLTRVLPVVKELAQRTAVPLSVDTSKAAVARACLAAVPADRPRDAEAVAAAMTAYLAGVQERLRAAELARVAAQGRARLTVAVAASVRHTAALYREILEEHT